MRHYRRNVLISFVLILGFSLGTIATILGVVGEDVEGDYEPTETVATVIIPSLTAPNPPTPTSTPTPTATPIPTPTPVPVDDDELYLMAHLIWGETGFDNEEMMYAVGSVVLNRVNHDAYPDTINDVIYQSGQYQCTWDGNFNKTPSDLAWEVAEELLTSGSTLPENVVYQAQFTQGSGIYTQIGNQYFCYY